MQRDDERNFLTVVEHRSGDGGHRPLLAVSIIVEKEAADREFGKQLVHDLANRSGNFVTLQGSNQLRCLRKRGGGAVDIESAFPGVRQGVLQPSCPRDVSAYAAANPFALTVNRMRSPGSPDGSVASSPSKAVITSESSNRSTTEPA
jgi:hypothetical protein